MGAASTARTVLYKSTINAMVSPQLSDHCLGSSLLATSVTQALNKNEFFLISDSGLAFRLVPDGDPKFTFAKMHTVHSQKHKMDSICLISSDGVYKHVVYGSNRHQHSCYRS